MPSTTVTSTASGSSNSAVATTSNTAPNKNKGKQPATNNSAEPGVKPNATVATKIGLSVPIKEKTIKAFVGHLGTGDASKVVPKQVPKSTIVTVSATVEKLLQCLIRACKTGIDGNNFTVAHVTGPVQADDSLVILSPFVTEALLNVQTSRANKKAKKSSKADAADDSEAPTTEEGSAPPDSQFSFSCSNQITKLIKDGMDNIRVASDAVDLVQAIVDEFYQKLVKGAYLIAQNSGRKTIALNDVIVSIKIMLPDRFAATVTEHVEDVLKRFKDLESTKNEGKESLPKKVVKAGANLKTKKKAAAAAK